VARTRRELQVSRRVHALVQDAHHIHTIIALHEEDQVAPDRVATVSGSDVVDGSSAIRLLRDPLDGAADLE
jgi:hypothetical protein